VTSGASKEAGYALLLADANRAVEAAKLAVSQHRHGAASRLKAAERFRDGIRSKLGMGPASAPAPAGPFAFDTLAPDFGVDEERP